MRGKIGRKISEELQTAFLVCVLKRKDYWRSIWSSHVGAHIWSIKGKELSSLTIVEDGSLLVNRRARKQLRNMLREVWRHTREKKSLLPHHELPLFPGFLSRKDPMKQDVLVGNDTAGPYEHVVSQSESSNHPSLSTGKDFLDGTLGRGQSQQEV